MKKHIAGISVFLMIAMIISCVMPGSALAAAKNRDYWRTLKKNTWSKTARYCYYRDNVTLNYKIKVPATGILTFKIKGKRKGDHECVIWLYSSKKRYLRGGDAGYYVEVLQIDQPVMVKKGTYYICWTDDSKRRTRIKYTYKKAPVLNNRSKEKAIPLVKGKKRIDYQNGISHPIRWYKFELKEADRLRFWTGCDEMSIHFYDSEGNELEWDSTYREDNDTYRAEKIYTKKVCPPGTYYLSFDAWGRSDFPLQSLQVNRSKVLYGAVFDILWK